MSLLARCPHCRHELPIAPKFRGQEVACVACDERFLFTGGPELSDSGEEYVAEAPAGETAEPEIDVEMVPVIPAGGRLRRAAKLFLVCILPALVAGGGAVYAWHRWKAGPADSGGPSADELGWPVVDAPAGFDPDTILTLHVYGAENEGNYLAVSQRVGSLADPAGASASKGGGAGGRMTFQVAPVHDPQAAARKIDFGVVESVRGRVITVRANTVPGLPPGADAIDRALATLQSPDVFRRMHAIEELRRLPADHRRTDVAAALERALADEATAFHAGQDILAALGVWGTEDSVPAIENCLKHDQLNGIFHRQTALMTLAKIKGKRALELIMAAFDSGNGFGFNDGRTEAKPAIIAFGPGAEDAVLERFRPDDPGRHVVICQILKEIGTHKSIPILEAAVKENRFLEPHAREAARSIQARGN